ncbi:hypothetical protein BB560_000248 [Smittium megazygosporum]|uniref:Sorting nexin-4 n=1 Tax=Smittium megazygosporum TaxID=133381 RepID=A0A2T9ZKY8_9FUNG|nr:hypothetical protein BB560_000248 [Smittium megazygosporum]
MDPEYNNVSWETDSFSKDVITSPTSITSPRLDLDENTSSALNSAHSLTNSKQTSGIDSPVISPKLDFDSRDLDPMSPVHPRSSFDKEPSTSYKPSYSSSNNPAQFDSPALDFDLVIEISEPRKEAEGSSNPYISFLVCTTKTDTISKTTTKIKRRRRYKDFVWLYNNLSSTYTSVAVPELPGRSRLGIEYISGNRFNSDFVSRRKESLERFITRISIHPVLKKTPFFQTFIEAKDWSSQYEIKGKKEMNVFDGISDSILNSFTKIKNRDPRFVQMGEAISRVEENVQRALKAVQSVVKNQLELNKLYKDFGSGWNDLAEIETDVTSILVSVGNTISLHASSLKTLNLLKVRDNKQIEYEELIEYHKSTDAEKERLINYQPGTGVSLVTNFIKGKVRDLRGIDPGVSRQQRIANLKKRCDELKNAVDTANSDLQRFNNDVVIEFDIFLQIKNRDLKNSLLSLSNMHIEYFEKSNQLWSDLLPSLKQLQIGNS